MKVGLSISFACAIGCVCLASLADESGDKGAWTVSGDVVVDAAGVTCSSITFDGNATVSGGPVTLGAGGITVGDGVTAEIASVIAGSENFAVTGAGYFKSQLTLSGANTFTGEMSISKLNFHAANDLAFGSPEGKTIFTSKGTCSDSKLTCGDDYARLCFDGIDTSEPFETYYDDNSARRFAWSANTTNVLRGAVVNKIGRVHFWAGANAYTVLSNDWSGISYNADQSSTTSARFEVFGEMKGLNRINFCQGTWVFHRRVGSYSSGKYGSEISKNSRMIMAATNVFAAADDAVQAYGVGLWGDDTTAVFDLNGYDQRIDAFGCVDGTTPQHYGKLTVTSGEPAVLRYDNVRDTEFFGVFTGAVSFSVEGQKTLTMSGASTSTGDLTVAVGSVRLAATGAWSGDVRVDDGASLTLMASGNLSEDATLSLGETGLVELSGAAPTVKALYINGVKMADNTYGSSQSSANVKDDGHFAGTGIVNVRGSAVTETVWSGAGDDTLLTNPNNWEGGVAPDFTTGLIKLRFGADAGCVTVPAGTHRLGAVTLAARNLEFRPADATSRLSFTALTYETDAGGTFVCTNAVPLLFELSQTWTLASTNAAFCQAAPMSSSSPVDWVIDGGEFHVTAPSGTPLEGTLTVKRARFYWEEAAALGMMSVTYTTGLTASDRLTFFGGVIPNDINLLGSDQLSAVYFKAGTTTEFTGVYNCNAKYDRTNYGDKSKVVFSGGVRNGNSWRSIFSELVFTNKPCEFGSFNSRGTCLQIWTTNNTFGAYNEGFLFTAGNTKIELHVPYAVNTNRYSGGLHPQLQATKNCAYDIFGCDQQFTFLREHPNYPMADGETWTLTSETPAQLKACQTQDETLSHLVVNGAAGLTLNGPKALTLAKRTCPTTGRLEVESGVLTLGEDECFPNLSEVRVTGGTFAVTAADQVNRKADWSVDPANGRVSIPAGVTLRGHNLYFKTSEGWQLQTGGDFTSENSSFVTGGGTLHMTGNSGLMLFIR